jgi:uncharacterized protein (DUF302 family)
MSSNQFIFEHASPFNVETTVQKLVEAAEKLEWQNPVNHNLQQSLAKSGKFVKPVQVVELCKPEFSGKLLEQSDERIASVIMPCRISVYEKDDGLTYVALIDFGNIIAGMPKSLAEPMSQAATETMEIVKSVIGTF